MNKLLVTEEMRNIAKSEKSCGWLEFPCEAFLLLTTPNAAKWKLEEADETHSLAQYNEWTQQGKIRIMPFLDVDMMTGKVQGHEGRHRALACTTAGIRTMPVAIYLRKKGYKEYYVEDTSGDRWVKTYYTLKSVPLVLHGQFAPTTIVLENKWRRESFWEAYNTVTAAIHVRATGPINIGFGWDIYSPRVESQILLDCMQLQGLRPGQQVQVVIDPTMREDESALLIRMLAQIRVQVVNGAGYPLAFFKAFVQTSDSVYYPDHELVGTAKLFRKVMMPKLKKVTMYPGKTNYPEFPVVERPVPPNTLPQYKTRPPAMQQTLVSLPRWAWNHL